MQGNMCIYCLFQICNIGLFFIGAGTSASGAYVCAKAEKLNWYDGSLVILGAVTFLMGLLGCKSKYSTSAMFMYNVGIFLCLVGQVAVTVLIIVFDKISTDIGTQDATIIRSVLGGICLFMLLCFVGSVCYYRSLKRNNKIDSYAELKAPVMRGPTLERVRTYKEIRERREEST